MLCRYARGETGMAVTASVEAHLVHCPACQARLAPEVDLPLDDAWTRVLDVIQEPPRPLLVRLLQRAGLGDSDAVLLAGARSVGGAWTLATLMVVCFAALSALAADAQEQTLYLVVAPLAPVLGVVAAFGSSDPLAAVARATPYPKARLALVRTAAVLVWSMPLSLAFGLAVPEIGTLAFGWLLPSLALVLIALAAMTWWAPEPVGAAISAGWLAVVGAAYARHAVTAAVGPEAQLIALVVAAVAAVVLTLRLGAARTPGGYA
jgi:hypothetical protein